MISDSYPGIKKAILEIAYDNGAVFSGRSEDVALASADRALEGRSGSTLREIDAWISSLTEENLSMACVGESEESTSLLAGSPAYTSDLLNDIFNCV